jgi:hypothetical protein
MTRPIQISATASVGVDTVYDSSIAFGVAAGLYIGGSMGGPSLLLWFDGATASDQCEAIDHAIDALGALKREARAAKAPPAEDASSASPVGPLRDNQRELVTAGVDVDDIPF